jgi:hypothetical protein
MTLCGHPFRIVLMRLCSSAKATGTASVSTMAKILFTNNRTDPIVLVLEPWAMAETIRAGGEATFEFSDSPPPEVQFAIEESGEAFVWLNSECVRVTIDGKLWDFNVGERFPSFAIFRTQNPSSIKTPTVRLGSFVPRSAVAVQGSKDHPVIASALAGLVNDRMNGINFLLDSVQLQFDEHCLNAYSPLSVVHDGNVTRQGWQHFRNSACALIGKHVTACRLEHKYLEIGFGETQIRLSLADEDYVGPEAGQYFSPQVELIFQRDGIWTIPDDRAE